MAVPSYGVCTALALLAALAVSVGEARRRALRPDKIWNLGLLAILAALIGARLLLVATHLRVFRAHPFWLLGLASVPGQWITLGGALIGIMAGILYALAENLPLPRVADVAAPAVALAFGINRVGAFLGGVAWGTRTTLPWGVTYRSVVAYLWYHVPLGIRLHPVQLYDAAVCLLLFAGLLVMLRRLRSGDDGQVAGAWLFLYGVARFFLEFMRGDETRERVLGGVLTPSQALAVLGVIVGGALWMRRTSEPDASRNEEPAAAQRS
jgi:phosphatidylglycerol:prolipoprotein diacylglycerol transferase